ncbi:MAG: hypothetical protein P8P74_08895 [Crocinitomicaceae bacterium]|nr:hypothetical protein [Crocinitomicaceae bacterium]
MIQKGTVPSVSIVLYGKQLIDDLDVPALDIQEQTAIPSSFQFNSSWRIEHECLSCGNVIGIDQDFEESTSNFTVLENVDSFNYSQQFLDNIATLFDSVELVKIQEVSYLNRLDFQYDFDFQRKSSVNITHSKCQNCKADYLGLIRVGSPMPTERGMEQGQTGTVEIADLVMVDTEIGFKEYCELHKTNHGDS